MFTPSLLYYADKGKSKRMSAITKRKDRRDLVPKHLGETTRVAEDDFSLQDLSLLVVGMAQDISLEIQENVDDAPHDLHNLLSHVADLKRLGLGMRQDLLVMHHLQQNENSKGREGVVEFISDRLLSYSFGCRVALVGISAVEYVINDLYRPVSDDQ